MSNEQSTPNALDVTKANIQSTIDGIQVLSGEIYTLIEVPQDTVEIKKDYFKDILERLDTLTKQSRNLLKQVNKQEQGSNLSLYLGALLGALLGIVGNFFVQLMFEPMTDLIILGWGISGIAFFVCCLLLVLLARKYSSK